jgi:hypothetical protein
MSLLPIYLVKFYIWSLNVHTSIWTEIGTLMFHRKMSPMKVPESDPHLCCSGRDFTPISAARSHDSSLLRRYLYRSAKIFFWIDSAFAVPIGGGPTAHGSEDTIHIKEYSSLSGTSHKYYALGRGSLCVSITRSRESWSAYWSFGSSVEQQREIVLRYQCVCCLRTTATNKTTTIFLWIIIGHHK